MDELDLGWSPQDDGPPHGLEGNPATGGGLGPLRVRSSRISYTNSGPTATRARQLAYLLFNRATEARNADEAASYNGLINAWPILRSITPDPQQQLL